MRLHERRCGANGHWDPWGFVIFKSPEISDAGRWKACRERFDRIIEECLNYYRAYPGIDEWLSNMQFRWIEDIANVDGDARGGLKAVAE